MGTRADFYIGTGRDAQWLGSVAWDGYPEGMPEGLLKAKTEKSFRAEVEKLSKRDDFTSPNDGWPWQTSHTTDYAYMFLKNKTVYACFGEYPNGKRAEFPDMKGIQNVTLGRRSGVILFGR